MNNIIKNKILTIRGKQVILDRDLAELYEVETKYLKRQVNRNIKRFPENFMFQLTKLEQQSLRCQNVTLETKRGEHSKYLSFVFTEQGVSMLSALLKSDKAIETSIQIINAFVAMRRFLSENSQLFQRLDKVEYKQIEYDKKLGELFNKIENKEIKQGIFYNGKIFDAYEFISKLIKQAKNEIILIDNYIDETTLTILSKNEVKTTIYTKSITNQLKLDIEKFKEQYYDIEVKITKDFHDRFLIIDNQTYHIGASIKDLGKKIFAFSKLDIDIKESLNN